MMGTRSGDLDPGVLFYFLQQKQLNALQLAELLKRSACSAYRTSLLT